MGNLTSLLGEMACVAWQNLTCYRWRTACFVKYSHSEEIPLFGPFPCLSLPTVHTTHRHTHMKRHGWEVRTGPIRRSPAHLPHTLCSRGFRPSWVTETLQTSLLLCREPGGNGAVNSTPVLKTVRVPHVESRRAESTFFGKTWSLEY